MMKTVSTFISKHFIQPFKLHKLDRGPASTSTLTADDALKMYENLVVLRRLESASGNLYQEKAIRGFCHLYSGQEAVAIGMRAAMRNVDTLITSYRCHSWAYLMGVSALGVLAELTGRKTGCSRGKGGSMHMYAKNFFGGNGIVGAQVPLGAGAGLAHKYNDDGGVNFCLYGDGAANQGQLFEAFNMAKLWSLPCVFVCENNRYGMGTSANRSSASTEYYTRGDYVPGLWVDAMDVLTTKEATKFGIEHCTSGKGPLVMEMSTYRFHGHSMSDPGTSYRSREEVQQMRQTKDPITTFKEQITKELVTAGQLKEIDIKVKKEIEEATQQSKKDPEVDVEELAADIYYKNYESKIRNVRPDQVLSHVEVAPRK
ncbi:probable pyruvate dehydrogenase E1 component subunit alpha, mitochondrial isoform X2 [Achroia grisella]|uniref:probable pyruvate dehydrogenase E1 component subunit alpha, mitochondrial isoform X2 n=1 Tax=Achroia grisella TaxID=688607 RepID=UPI0027D29C73|nr:probable pyruvate dehydrogenase E1 component subunit alpha, mitochondrial isoform X2 [Achroia grisella]